MKPKIKTILRKPWHRETDRWQWRGMAYKFVSSRKPKWSRLFNCGLMAWSGQCDACQRRMIISTQSQRRNSLRRIVDRKPKKGVK